MKDREVNRTCWKHCVRDSTKVGKWVHAHSKRHRVSIGAFQVKRRAVHSCFSFFFCLNRPERRELPFNELQGKLCGVHGG